jgi:hypothetical protein
VRGPHGEGEALLRVDEALHWEGEVPTEPSPPPPPNGSFRLAHNR